MQKLKYKLKSSSFRNKKARLPLIQSINPALVYNNSTKTYGQEGYSRHIYPCPSERISHKWWSMKELIHLWQVSHPWWKKYL